MTLSIRELAEQGLYPACALYPPAAFFPDDSDLTAADCAQRVCRTECPTAVFAACDKLQRDTHSVGVWAGRWIKTRRIRAGHLALVSDAS